MKHLFHHLFLPRHTNNFKARILHNAWLAIFAIFFLGLSGASYFIKINSPEILGVSYSINIQELLQETNNNRRSNGLEPFQLNEALNRAASGKAQHMMIHNYWAHFAPDGTTPWVFITDAGYSYTYAGENLAKGFTKSDEVVRAWMNSSSHRENILSPKYNEVGFAIFEGKLEGEETVLVVQMFGSQKIISDTASVSQVQSQETYDNSVLPEEIIKGTIQEQEITDEKQEQVIVSPVISTPEIVKPVTLFVVLFLVVILLLDLIIIERRKIPRIAGHNIDHIILLTLFIVFIYLQQRGGIL